MAQIVIANVTGYDVANATLVTLYFSTQGYVTQSTDVPADTYYDGRIQQPADIQRACFDQGSTYGQTTVGYGDMVLVNADHQLDFMLGYSFSGRPIEIKIGTVTQLGVVTWTTLIYGTMEQLDVAWETITIKVRDRQQDLTIPLQPTMYGGTNALPAGIDGVATDLKGKRLPLVFGQVLGVEPALVNTSKLIYQFSSTALTAVNAIYDRGVVLSVGTARANQAAMEASAPGAGTYDYWLAGGCIRLGTTPSGTVTGDVTQGATTADRTSAQIMKAIMLQGGILVGDINAADVTALDTVCSYVVGCYLAPGDDSPGSSMLDLISNSIGAYWGADRLGKFRMGRIIAPLAALSVGTLTDVEILTIDRMATSDQGSGVPCWSVTIGYARIYSPSTDLAGSVSVAEIGRQSQEYRTVVSQVPALKTAYLTSPDMRFDTQIISPSDAASEAARRQALYGVRRDMYQLRVRLDDTLTAILDLGVVVILQLPRYDMTSGKPFLITAIRANAQANFFDLTLWG